MSLVCAVTKAFLRSSQEEMIAKCSFPNLSPFQLASEKVAKDLALKPEYRKSRPGSSRLAKSFPCAFRKTKKVSAQLFWKTYRFPNALFGLFEFFFQGLHLLFCMIFRNTGNLCSTRAELVRDVLSVRHCFRKTIFDKF